jgi:hypothetical protein
MRGAGANPWALSVTADALPDARGIRPSRSGSARAPSIQNWILGPLATQGGSRQDARVRECPLGARSGSA